MTYDSFYFFVFIFELLKNKIDDKYSFLDDCRNLKNILLILIVQ